MFTFITKSTYETNFGRLITWETLPTDAPASVYLLYSDTDDSHILFRQLSTQSSYHCYVERRWHANLQTLSNLQNSPQEIKPVESISELAR